MSAFSFFGGGGPDTTMLAVALAADILLGDPPNGVHPVAWMGRLTSALVRRAPIVGARRQLVAGGLIVAGVCGACVGSIFVLGWATAAAAPALRFWVGAAILKCMFAIKGLGAAGAVVREALLNHRIADARRGLSALCSRDAATLDEQEIAAAAIESLAENLSDSFVAPLLAYALFGLPGAVVYRAANTLDAMIGYRGRYEYLGRAAARLDDFLNLIPARITAVLLLVAGAAMRADLRRGVRVLRRDRGATASPNAGWPMATMAGLLGVSLAKAGHYQLGDATRRVRAGDIDRAWRIVAVAAGLAAAGVFAILFGLRAHGI